MARNKYCGLLDIISCPQYLPSARLFPHGTDSNPMAMALEIDGCHLFAIFLRMRPHGAQAQGPNTRPAPPCAAQLSLLVSVRGDVRSEPNISPIKLETLKCERSTTGCFYPSSLSAVYFETDISSWIPSTYLLLTCLDCTIYSISIYLPSAGL